MKFWSLSLASLLLRKPLIASICSLSLVIVFSSSFLISPVEILPSISFCKSPIFFSYSFTLSSREDFLVRFLSKSTVKALWVWATVAPIADNLLLVSSISEVCSSNEAFHSSNLKCLELSTASSLVLGALFKV